MRSSIAGMSQSFDVIYVHLVFNTYKRNRYIHRKIQPLLSAYISGTLTSIGCPCVKANCVEDHVHVLFRLSKHKALVDIVKTVKQASSKWIKEQAGVSIHFKWAAGYAAFSVDRYRVNVVIRYIERQQQHHKATDWRKEMKMLVQEYGIEDFNETYFFSE